MNSIETQHILNKGSERFSETTDIGLEMKRFFMVTRNVLVTGHFKVAVKV